MRQDDADNLGTIGRETKIATKLLGAMLIVGLALLVFGIFHKAQKLEYSQASSVRDLANHPIYSKYEFGKGESVINVGVQPLYLPTGLISEAMKRDAILREALSRLGMDIHFYAFLKGDDVNFFLRRGDLDVGIGGDMPAISAAADMDIIVPALIQQGFSSIVAKRLMLMNELRGKRIGYAFGSNAHYTLLNALVSAGLTEDEVDLISMEVAEMPDALNEGEIDAFSAWEPTPAMTLMKYPNNAAIIHRGLSTGYMYFVEAFSERRPEAMRQIIAAEIRALQWMKSDRENLRRACGWASAAGAELSGHDSGLSAEQYARLAAEDILGTAPVPIIPEIDLAEGGRLSREFHFLKDLGKISETVDWEKVKSCFDRTITTEILLGAKEYQIARYEYSKQEGDSHAAR